MAKTIRINPAKAGSKPAVAVPNKPEVAVPAAPTVAVPAAPVVHYSDYKRVDTKPFKGAVVKSHDAGASWVPFEAKASVAAKAAPRKVYQYLDLEHDQTVGATLDDGRKVKITRRFNKTFVTFN